MIREPVGAPERDPTEEIPRTNHFPAFPRILNTPEFHNNEHHVQKHHAAAEHFHNAALYMTLSVELSNYSELRPGEDGQEGQKVRKKERKKERRLFIPVFRFSLY